MHEKRKKKTIFLCDVSCDGNSMMEITETMLLCESELREMREREDICHDYDK